MAHIKNKQSLIVDIVALDTNAFATGQGCNGGIINVHPVLVLMVIVEIQLLRCGLIHILHIAFGRVRSIHEIKIIKKVGSSKVILEHIGASSSHGVRHQQNCDPLVRHTEKFS